MNITIENASFFRELIADWDKFFNQIPDALTANGGFFAGGLIRRALQKGSFYNVFAAKNVDMLGMLSSSWLHQTPDAFTSETYQWPDIDIFYRTKAGYEAALKCVQSYGVAEIVTSRYAKTIESQLILQDPKGKGKSLLIRPKLQLVGDVIEHGSPEKVLGNFDICNCMVAYDPFTSDVYYHDAVFSDEFKLNDEFTSELHAFRVAKYLNLYNNKISKASIPLLQAWATQRTIELQTEIKERGKEGISLRHPDKPLQDYLALVTDPMLAHVFDYKHYLTFAAIPRLFRYIRGGFKTQNDLLKHFGRTFAGRPIVELTPQLEILLISWWKIQRDSVPEVKIVSTPIIAKPRKLKAKWTANPAITVDNTAFRNTLIESIATNARKHMDYEILKEMIDESKATP
jgi:hypothetical protein